MYFLLCEAIAILSFPIMRLLLKSELEQYCSDYSFEIFVYNANIEEIKYLKNPLFMCVSDNFK